MEAFDRVSAARAKGRPTGRAFIENLFEDFIEMHGDRRFADDKAVIAGIARLNGMPVTVIALEKGVDVKDKDVYKRQVQDRLLLPGRRTSLQNSARRLQNRAAKRFLWR